jgi:hypothetical protein
LAPSLNREREILYCSKAKEMHGACALNQMNEKLFVRTWSEGDYVDGFGKNGGLKIRLVELGGRLDFDKFSNVAEYFNELNELVLLKLKQLNMAREMYDTDRISKRLYTKELEEFERLTTQQENIRKFLNIIWRW